MYIRSESATLALALALLSSQSAWAASSSTTDNAVQADSDSAYEVKYCGVGYIGAHADLTTNYPYLANTVFKDDQGIGEVSGRMLRLSNGSNPGLKIYDSTSSVASSSRLALTYLVAGVDHEAQAFIDPRSQRRMYNNLYTLTINTMLFDMDSKQVIGLYPWRYQYNVASAEIPTQQEKEAQFAVLFAEPRAVAEGESLDGDQMLSMWRESLKDFRIAQGTRSIAATPVEMSPQAIDVLLQSQASKAEIDKLSRDLTSSLESLLTAQLKLPIVPSGGGSQATTGEKYVATIPQCLGAAASDFSLPAPDYRFQVQVDALKAASLDHVAEPRAGSQAAEQGPLVKKEVAYGGRYVVQVSAPDEASAEQVILTNKLKYTIAKRYFGTREFTDLYQFRKTTVSFMNELLAQFVDPQKDWIEDHLSAESKDKPSDIKKKWTQVFRDRMGLKPSKKGKQS